MLHQENRYSDESKKERKKVLSNNIELKKEINSKEMLNTVLVQMLEKYSSITLNMVENSQEKEED